LGDGEDVVAGDRAGLGQALLGADLDRPAGDVVSESLERGLLVAAAGERTLRLSPPLTITDDEIDPALTVLEEVLA